VRVSNLLLVAVAAISLLEARNPAVVPKSSELHVKGKTCIITGATRGIGLEAAARLGALGAGAIKQNC
jgi:hypothetical protein